MIPEKKMMMKNSKITNRANKKLQEDEPWEAGKTDTNEENLKEEEKNNPCLRYLFSS